MWTVHFCSSLRRGARASRYPHKWKLNITFPTSTLVVQNCCVVWQHLKCATHPFLVISDDGKILCLTRSTNFLKSQQHKIIAVSHASAFTSQKIILSHLFWFHSENELGHGQWTHNLMRLCMSSILQHFPFCCCRAERGTGVMTEGTNNAGSTNWHLKTWWQEC